MLLYAVVLSDSSVAGVVVCIYTVCGLLVWVGGRLVLWVVVGGGYLCLF
jgi:uncharacterized membrane protein